MIKSKDVAHSQVERTLTWLHSYIVPGLGDFGDRFYTM